VHSFPVSSFFFVSYLHRSDVVVYKCYVIMFVVRDSRFVARRCSVLYVYMLSAFTTWLFGTMFHLLCVPSSNVILSNSIEVQACMLRILSKHYMTMFETISLEYLNIFDGT
jgi:hypothetical protein